MIADIRPLLWIVTIGGFLLAFYCVYKGYMGALPWIGAITVTLPTENWSGRAQTVQDEFLLADGKYWYIVCADADCFMAASETGVKADNITTDGQVTFRCEVTPTENLTISILRLEVEQSNE